MTMATPDSSHRYNVRETAQFTAEWRRATLLGYLNPTTDPELLEQVKEWLRENPYMIRQLPGGVPANRRRIRLSSGVELWYSIIEDDRVVLLENVLRIDPN